MSSFALVDVSKFIPHFLRVLQQSIYFTEKMIHGFSALFESFTIPILAYFLKTEKGQHTEIIHVLSLLLAASWPGTLLVAEIMTADFYIKIRCERIS